jgi:hypothetical protein
MLSRRRRPPIPRAYTPNPLSEPPPFCLVACRRAGPDGRAGDRVPMQGEKHQDTSEVATRAELRDGD